MAEQVHIVGDVDMVCCEETIDDNNSVLITSHSMLLSNFEDAWHSREWTSSLQSEEKLDSDNTCSSPTANKNQAWSDKEKQLFNDGLVLYGRKWTKIARFIGTRSVLQVRAYVRKQNVKNQREQKKLLNAKQTPEVIKLTKDVVDDINVDVEDGDVKIDDEKCVENIVQVANILEKNSNNKEVADNDELVDICSDNLSIESENVIQEEENSLPESENLLQLTIPLREIYLDRKSISEDEKQYHHEYFEGKLPKTPDRYMKIRNHILDLWDKVKPNYLNKTAVRLGLKNCGDVNCIGRIHEYLEMCGAINFACEQASYNRNQSSIEVKPFRRKSVKNELNDECNLKQSSRLRKRKIFPDNETVGSNYTIKHTPEGEIIMADSNKNAITNKIPRNVNPFKLISCANFTDKPPFSIHLDLSALIVIDIHAHLSHAEVIGLLGGRFDFEKHLIELTVAEPCLSESTGVQCEMDPVSQTEASVSIEQRGLSVVGWYHSHPTFPPNPSVRDLETQAKYQDWFSQRGFPFVALILTPYCGNIVSKLKCMWVGNEIIFGSYRKPFQFDLNLRQNAFKLESCLNDMKKVLKDVDKSSPINLNSFYIHQAELTITYLEKLLKSIKHHMNNVGVESAMIDDIAQQIENSLLQTLK